MLLLQSLGCLFAFFEPCKERPGFVVGALGLELQLINFCHKPVVLVAQFLHRRVSQTVFNVIGWNLTRMSFSLSLSIAFHSSILLNS